jgi:hypothetical protein
MEAKWISVPSAWICVSKTGDFASAYRCLIYVRIVVNERRLNPSKCPLNSQSAPSNVQIVTPSIRDGFTLMERPELANVLTPCDHFHVQTGTKGSNYRRPRPISARCVSALIAIGDRLLQLSTRVETKQLCAPTAGEAGRSAHHSLFHRNFMYFVRLLYYYCCNATLGQAATNHLRYGRTRGSINWRVESCYISLASTDEVIE